jgi:hypothetical protein
MAGLRSVPELSLINPKSGDSVIWGNGVNVGSGVRVGTTAICGIVETGDGEATDNTGSVGSDAELPPNEQANDAAAKLSATIRRAVVFRMVVFLALEPYVRYGLFPPQ